MYGEGKRRNIMVNKLMACVYASAIPVHEIWNHEDANKTLRAILGVNVVTHSWLETNETDYQRHVWFTCISVGDALKLKVF